MRSLSLYVADMAKLSKVQPAATMHITMHESKQYTGDTLTCGYRGVPRHVPENRQRPVTLIGDMLLVLVVAGSHADQADADYNGKLIRSTSRPWRPLSVCQIRQDGY